MWLKDAVDDAGVWRWSRMHEVTRQINTAQREGRCVGGEAAESIIKHHKAEITFYVLLRLIWRVFVWLRLPDNINLSFNLAEPKNLLSTRFSPLEHQILRRKVTQHRQMFMLLRGKIISSAFMAARMTFYDVPMLVDTLSASDHLVALHLCEPDNNKVEL